MTFTHSGLDGNDHSSTHSGRHWLHLDQHRLRSTLHAQVVGGLRIPAAKDLPEGKSQHPYRVFEDSLGNFGSPSESGSQAARCLERVPDHRHGHLPILAMNNMNCADATCEVARSGFIVTSCEPWSPFAAERVDNKSDFLKLSQLACTRWRPQTQLSNPAVSLPAKTPLE